MQHQVRLLLQAYSDGDRSALDALFPLVYDELRQQAHRQRQQWRGELTLNTTALVHEAYLKLVDHQQEEWRSRAHFCAVAAKAMRHILINYAEHRRALKRGGAVQKVSLDDVLAAEEAPLTLTDGEADTLVALEEALARLEQVSPRQGQVVECRFYGGMTIADTAEALGCSPATVKRDWVLAQAWLHNEIRQDRTRSAQ